MRGKVDSEQPENAQNLREVPKSVLEYAAKGEEDQVERAAGATAEEMLHRLERQFKKRLGPYLASFGP